MLPRPVLLIAAAVGLVLLTLCALTAYVVLRARGRQRVSSWSGRRILTLLGAAVVPWLVVWFAPINIVVNFRGLGPLLGWLFIALSAFALLVLLPIAALASAGVWWSARR